MKKQLFSIILILAALLSLMVVSVSASETVDLTVADVTAQPGTEVAVAISLSNNTGLAGLKFNVEYDSVLTLTNVTFNNAFGSYVTAPEPYTNPQSLSMVSPLEASVANDVFAILTFKVSETAAYGYKAQISITYDSEDVFDGELQNVSLSVTNGSVTVACAHTNTINVPATAPGATSVGYTAGVYCNDCKIFVSGHEEIPALGYENAPKIVISNATVTAGSTVTLTMSIENNPGIAWMVLSLNYDTTVFTSVTVENGDLISDMDYGANLVWSDDSDILVDGVLCIITFTIPEGTPAGEYDISATFYEAFDYKDNEHTFTVTKGVLKVIDFEYGDANGDGKINGRDVLLLRQYMANYNFTTGTSTVEVFPGADANGDGKINGRDVLLLRQYMANYDFVTGSSTVVLGPQ